MLPVESPPVLSRHTFYLQLMSTDSYVYEIKIFLTENHVEFLSWKFLFIKFTYESETITGIN